MDTGVRDLEVAFFLRLIPPDLTTNVSKIYQIGLYMLCQTPITYFSMILQLKCKPIVMNPA